MWVCSQHKVTISCRQNAPNTESSTANSELWCTFECEQHMRNGECVVYVRVCLGYRTSAQKGWFTCCLWRRLSMFLLQLFVRMEVKWIRFAKCVSKAANIVQACLWRAKFLYESLAIFLLCLYIKFFKRVERPNWNLLIKKRTKNLHVFVEWVN